jgi:hypothetical protein
MSPTLAYGLNGDGTKKCTTQCTFAPYCGDGRVEAAFGEVCDPKQNSNCASDCKSFTIVVN